MWCRGTEDAACRCGTSPAIAVFRRQAGARRIHQSWQCLRRVGAAARAATRRCCRSCREAGRRSGGRVILPTTRMCSGRNAVERGCRDAPPVVSGRVPAIAHKLGPASGQAQPAERSCAGRISAERHPINTVEFSLLVPAEGQRRGPQQTLSLRVMKGPHCPQNRPSRPVASHFVSEPGGTWRPPYQQITGTAGIAF